VAQQISVDIVINGTNITPFSHLSIRQLYNDHHYFELQFNHDVIETFGAVTFDKGKAFLGKSISISFNTLDKSGSDVSFKGIVTDIRFANHLSTLGDIIFSGYSPTILLEGGETNMSFLDAGLSKVVKDITSTVASNDLSVKVNPTKKSNIPYITQYRESNFAFIRRLAAEYGEDFFYDGNDLYFGKPSGGTTVKLQYPTDITDLNIRAHVAPVAFKQGSYLSKEAKPITKPSKAAQVAGLDGLGQHALSVSDQLFKTEMNFLTRRKFKDEKELEEAVKIDKSIRSADLVILQGISDSPALKLGATVQITAKEADYGKYTVTSITHRTDGSGNYQNEFEAIPSTVTIMPNPYFKKPVAEPQIAVVTDNTDPDKLGKIKVKLLWQEDNQTTPFIRVMTPHGGTYGDGKKTRGSFFTPEVDDYVIVGFTQNDPDRPFVMGSLQNGKAIDSAPNTDNTIKSISTRSGNIITFSDKKDEESINIQTDPANYIEIKLAKTDGTIKIFANKAIEVNSGETIKINAAKSIDMQGDQTVTIKSKDIAIEASNSIKMKANASIEISATDVKIEASNGFSAKANATAKIESVQTEVSGSASAKIKGAMLDLEGSAMANLKAALVKIN
jgi:type VI secretion system secreted protein VgrG